MKVLRNGKAVEKVEPPSVDISSDAVATRINWLRHDDGVDYQFDLKKSADMLEAIAVDRDRLAKALDVSIGDTCHALHQKSQVATELSAAISRAEKAEAERDEAKELAQDRLDGQRIVTASLREDLAAARARIWQAEEAEARITEKVEPPAVGAADAIADEESRLDALAEAEIEGCDRRGHHAGWTPQPSDYASAATTPYRAALRESKATIARISADRDRIAADHDLIADDRDSLRNDLVEAKRDRNRLSADLEAAREALEPFAKVPFLDQMESIGAQIIDWRTTLTVGDYRRARAVLAKLSPREDIKARDAATDVTAERERQKAVECWTEAHDDGHTDGSLAQAAACYAMPDGSRYMIQRGQGRGMYFVPAFWPPSWAGGWWKPKDRRRDLVRAGALILAEIERLDRAVLAKLAKGE